MIRFDDALLRVKRIRQSRNGSFCVADLSTDIGEFKVKDPLLDQFDEGDYTATVWISEIYLAQYVAFGKGVTEIRAKLYDLQVQAQGALRHEQEQAEPDPLDEREPTRVAPPVPAAPAPPSAAKPKASDWDRFKKKRGDAPAGGAPVNDGQREKAQEQPAPEQPSDQGVAALFDAEQLQAIRNREPVKLDATIERSLLRRQAAELGQKLRYGFDPKQQTWFAQ